MKGTTTREEEYVEHLFVATNHNYILFFLVRVESVIGSKYMKFQKEGRLARGRAIVNLIEIKRMMQLRPLFLLNRSRMKST